MHKTDITLIILPTRALIPILNQLTVGLKAGQGAKKHRTQSVPGMACKPQGR